MNGTSSSLSDNDTEQDTPEKIRRLSTPELKDKVSFFHFPSTCSVMPRKSEIPTISFASFKRNSCPVIFFCCKYAISNEPVSLRDER